MYRLPAGSTPDRRRGRLQVAGDERAQSLKDSLGLALCHRALIDIDASVSFLSTGSLKDSYTSIRSCTNSMKAFPTPGCSFTQANVSLASEIFLISRLKKPCSISLTLVDMRSLSNWETIL